MPLLSQAYVIKTHHILDRGIAWIHPQREMHRFEWRCQ